MTEADETAVLIVGAGPVGTTLAMDLARLGVPSIIVERRRLIPPNPRCNTTNARSMELFRRLGCADAIRAAGLPADFNTDVVYMTRLNGTEITRYERSTPAEVRAGTQHGVAANWPTPEPQHFLSQIYLEPILRDHASDHWGVDLRAGWELGTITQDDSGVTATTIDVDTGEERTVRSRYLVGCDGAGSIVRKAIGSRLEGMAGLNNMCSTYFRSKRVAEIAADAPGWMLRFVGGGILVAIDGHEGWLLHNGVPPEEDPATWDPEAAMFAAIGEPFDYEVIDRSRWTPRAMVATKWRERNVFLAGDAAHVWVPMGGFGMNAGVADAVSLSWRLAAAVDGWGTEGLLDSYETERAPIGESIAGQAVTWALNAAMAMLDSPGRVEQLEDDTATGATARTDLDEQIRRDTLSEFDCPGFQLGFIYRDSPINVADDLTTEPEPMVIEYHPTSWPGARLPHIATDSGVPVYDLLGPGFTLLRVGPDAPDGAALTDPAAAAGIPLAVVDVDVASVGDAWDEIPLILVRPDQHIAWRSRTEPTADEATDIWRTATGASIPARQPIEVTATAAPDVPQVARTDEQTLPGGQVRYVVRSDRSGIDQQRLHADGTPGALRPFLDQPVADIAVDALGGVWVCEQAEQTVTRYDGAARPTHTAAVDGPPLRCAVDDDRAVTVITAGVDGAETAWRVDPTAV